MDPDQPPRRAASPARGLRLTRAAVVLVTVVVGLAASALAWRLANENAGARQRAAARSIAEATRSTALNAIAGLGGAAALTDSDGTVSAPRFESFQRDVDAASSLQALAYVPTVRGKDRAAFEARIGRPILDRAGAAFTPAAARDFYWPVLQVSPADVATTASALIGLDIAADPFTVGPATAARDTGRTTVTQAAVLPDRSTLFFILKPLYRPGVPVGTVEDRRSALVGFVASAYSGAQLRAAIVAQVAEGVRYRVSDGSVVLAASDPGPAGGDTRPVSLGGRILSVRVQDARPVNHELTWFLLAITAVIVGSIAVLTLRSARYERAIARTSTLIGRTADFARHLAGAATADQVAAIIGADVPAIFGAESASFELVDRTDGITGANHGPDALTVSSERFGRSPHDGVASMARGLVTLALESSDGTVVATVGICWSGPQDFDDTIVATLQTVTELCEQSLERASATDRAVDRAADLARLAELLAGAGTIAEAATVITGHGRQPVGASAASIGITDREAGVLRVHHGDTVSDRLGQRYANPPLEARLAFTDAARTGEMVLIPDFESYQDLYPGTDPAVADLGTGARAALPLRGESGVMGAIVFAWTGPRRFDDALVFSLSTIAEMASQTVQRARLTEAQAADARHSKALARLAQGLAGRAHTDDIAQYLTESVPNPLDADHAVVGIIEGGKLRRHVSRHLARPDLSDLAEALSATPIEASTPLTDAVRTGADVMLADPAALDAHYPAMAEAWDRVGIRALAALVLHDRAGRPIGGFSVAWGRAVTFDEDLSDRLRTVVGIVGQTLERARLSDELRDSAERNELLADFAQNLAQVRTVDALCAAVAEQAGAAVGSATADIGLIDDVYQGLEIRPHPFPGPSPVAHLGERPPDSPGPDTDAIRTRRAILLGSPADILDRYPGRVAATTAAAGIESSAHLPLVGPDGDPLGALGFAWTTPQQFSPTTRAALRTLAELCSQTLERTRLGEAEHRLVQSLQHRVVTPLPPSSGITIAQRYLPAAQQVGMGGDWYEGIAFDEHRYALIIGDIAGHGITAVADMIQLQAIIGSQLRSTTPLDELFPRVAALLNQGRGGLTATAWVAVVDTLAGSVRYVSAGHLPAVLRRPNGHVDLLQDGRQPLLGVPGRIVTPGTAPFAPGSLLVTCTDGLIERRREPIDASIGRLVDAVRSLDGDDPEAMADLLIDRCLQDGAPEDDVALVVVARDGSPAEDPSRSAP